MTVNEVLARARYAMGRKTKYRLGGGATYRASLPKDAQGECDCSGLVCWVLGISRYQPQFEWLKKLNGGWVNTDGIWSDLLENTGLFESAGGPQAGALIVYPSRRVAIAGGYEEPGPAIGHVGILTSPAKVIHCSAGNYRRTGDAIQETDLKVFRASVATDYAWPAMVERP